MKLRTFIRHILLASTDEIAFAISLVMYWAKTFAFDFSKAVLNCTVVTRFMRIKPVPFF